MSEHHLVLIGMMGAGKTTVGKSCSKRLGRKFVDTDDLVEATARMTVAEIFEQQGEDAFRKLEHEEVVRACGSDEPMVIACGGGVVKDPENRDALKQAGVVVWLRATASVLGDRVRPQGATRPLIASVEGATPVETLDRIAADRDAMYREVADVQIDTSTLNLDQVADAVVDAFERESA